jgi:hypothetical protein
MMRTVLSPTKMNERCLWCGRVVGEWKPLFSLTWWTTMREHGIDPATGHFESCRYSGIYATGLIRRLRTNAAALLDSGEAHLLGLAKDFRDAADEIEQLAAVSLSLLTSLGTDEIIEHQMAGRFDWGLLGASPQHAAAVPELFPTCFPADRTEVHRGGPTFSDTGINGFLAGHNRREVPTKAEKELFSEVQGASGT